VALLATKPKDETAVAAMFDKIAKRYDFLNRLLSARRDQSWRKHLAKRIPFRLDGAMLDVATGTGDVILAATVAHPEYKKFVGVDISANMLELARQKAQQRRLQHAVEFLPMSAAAINLPSQSFDCVSISFGLRNVVDKDAAISEFFRVLKPGGRLMILEFFAPSGGILHRLFRFYFESVLPRIGALMSDKDAYTYLPSSVLGFYSLTELLQRLKKQGFKLTETKSFLFGGCQLIVVDK
jgi:demethylmenaquinone methyltransferase/2-methoxy-6-polyprenyl-1,4-benzoquinol methylase